MNRIVIFQTASWHKVPEVKRHFDPYGIVMIHEKNKFLSPEKIISKYKFGLDKILVAIIRERSSLVKTGTLIRCDMNHLEDAEHLSELKVYQIKNNKIVNIVNYSERTCGYIDLYSDPIPAKFDWDNKFYLLSCHMNYVQLNEINIKISSRDACVSKYITEHLFYKNKIDLAYHPQKQLRSIDFDTNGIRTVLNNLIKSNPKMIDYGIAKIIDYVYQNGIYFMSAINRRIKLNWNPGINGIPFTGKPNDIMHELTYMIHDFGHFAVRPDVIFIGNHNDLYYRVYMITRMMSEAITIILADMIFVHSIIESGNNYPTVASRKIYPLFLELDINLDLNNEKVFLDSLYKLLEANVFYCLLGDDTFFTKLLKNRENTKALNDYKEKYSQYFIQDYLWTQNNYNQMLKQVETHKQWYQSINQLNKQYDLNLVSINELCGKMNLQNDKLNNYDLIKLIFNYVFDNNVKHLFINRQNNNNNFVISENNLSKAFVRYICNQIFIFDKFKYKNESTIYKNKIIKYLLMKCDNKIEPTDIKNIRSFYKTYLDSCYNCNLITIDDMNTYDELYSIIDPHIVNYDKKYPEPLDIVANKILNYVTVDK